MVSLLRQEWLSDPKLKKWDSVGCTVEENCTCKTDKYHVELWEQDSCVRGRIDTIICTLCDTIKSFRIVR